MRGFLFVTVTRISAWHIIAIQAISNGLCSFIGLVGQSLMKLIDKKRLAMYEHILLAESGEDLQQQNLELSLLSSAQQIRDHAKDSDDWTDGHTNAINAIGDALVGEAGWPEEDVHVYLKELVESIEGLEYGD